MPTDTPPALRRFTATILSGVRSDEPDLTQRQLAILLIVYQETEPQTVRGLARLLNVSKPAISRALDRLHVFDLARRKPDPLDRRSVDVERTEKGIAYVQRISEALKAAGA
jgi:DNA-binding MarR family transcriptional regulator